jgi:hypothetical protein
METPRERVISVSLNEADWQAFIRLHPQPVNWLRERIQESIVDPKSVIVAPAATGAVNKTSATTR